MTYHFRCTNISCELRNEEIEIEMPMSESGKTQYCEKCKEPMRRVFGSPSIKTGDGVK